MNLPARRRRQGATLPDPWHPAPQASPPELESFDALVRAMVQEHSNPDASVDLRSAARFATFMLSHGMSAATVRSGLAQLVRELRTSRSRWARTTVLDRLQWDVFRHYYARVQPTFATFFSNSTAHLQHVYWREMQPDRFVVKPTPEALQSYRDAILTGYRAMDRLLGEAVELAGPGTAIVFCTAIGQQPYLLGEALGGKRCYRPRDARGLVADLRLDGVLDVVPLMSEQFRIRFADAGAAERGARIVQTITLDDRRALETLRTGSEVVAGCVLMEEVTPGRRLQLAGADWLTFDEVFYRLPDAKSGYHHPDGMLWMRHPEIRPRVLEKKVPLTSVAPTVLCALGLEPPEQMRAERLHTMFA